MLKENQVIPYSTSDIPKGPYLVFSPHPDDETLGMGGVIALAARSGIEVHVVFVTSGGKGGNVEVRIKESEAASEILGVRKRFYLNLPDRGVFSARLKGEQLYEIFKEVSPVTVFLPSFQEFHPDHRAVTFKLLQFLNNSSEVSS
ncbi:MAG: PIG-L family deacetylase, partial [Thermodesulfobacteriota bacterium]|nr:PIG-L family deacetylase [Thermodesulfobacteriota bacterium]